MTTPAQPTEQDKARSQLIVGAAIVMGACVFGGLTAVVLMALNYRMAAGVVAMIAVVIIIVGIVVQVGAAKKLKPSRK